MKVLIAVLYGLGMGLLVASYVAVKKQPVVIYSHPVTSPDTRDKEEGKVIWPQLTVTPEIDTFFI